MSDEIERWMSQLEDRHLADLQFAEVTRALRALSSAYVERRHTAIAAHKVLDGAGKRAAFALYYGPLHFLAIRHILATLGVERFPVLPIVDLGCGTGAAGAAAALAIGARGITGIDTHPWALDEARHTYAAFGLDATLSRGSAGRFRVPRAPSLVVAAYVVNELSAADRAALLSTLLQSVRRGSRVLIVEPLARGVSPWWPEWTSAFAGARVDEWKLATEPPPFVQKLGHAAGLTSAAINLRTICAGPED